MIADPDDRGGGREDAGRTEEGLTVLVPLRDSQYLAEVAPEKRRDFDPERMVVGVPM